MGSFGEQIVKIEELAKKSRDKHKGDELQVAYQFIEYHNNVYGTDYTLSKKQPLSTDDPVDVLINSKSDSRIILKIQVKTFDSKFRAIINTTGGGEFLRIVNRNELHPLIREFKEAIPKLEIKYKDINKELVILFDGFWGFNLEERLVGDLRNLFTNKRFKEAWLVYSRKKCINLL